MLKSKIVSVCKGPETLMTQSAVVPNGVFMFKRQSSHNDCCRF